MAKQERVAANWVEVDPATLGEKAAAAYAAYKAKYAEAKVLKQEFEREMGAMVTDPAKRMVFGYNFGKLSVAIVDVEPSKPKAAKLTMADLVAMAGKGR